MGHVEMRREVPYATIPYLNRMTTLCGLRYDRHYSNWEGLFTTFLYNFKIKQCFEDDFFIMQKNVFFSRPLLPNKMAQSWPWKS